MTNNEQPITDNESARKGRVFDRLCLFCFWTL